MQDPVKVDARVHVDVCAFVDIYTRIYICIGVYVDIYTRMYICVRMRMYVYIRVYVDTRVHACIHTRMSVACKTPSFSFLRSTKEEGGRRSDTKQNWNVFRKRQMFRTICKN